MSQQSDPILARLEEVRRQFNEAAIAHPCVDALVVSRPDLRSDMTLRQIRDLIVKPANPESDQFAEELAEQTKDEYEAIRLAKRMDAWIPARHKSIEEIGSQVYRHGIMRAESCPEYSDLSAHSEVWQCILFGPPCSGAENAAVRLFGMFASTAVRLVLSGNLPEKSRTSRWLVHLTECLEPVYSSERRQFLRFPTREQVQSGYTSPNWIPVAPQNPTSNWWAVHLSNVFHLSARAIQEAIQTHSDSPSPVASTSVNSSPQVPSWIKDHFRQQQYSLLCALWGRDDVREDELIRRLGYSGAPDPEGNLRRRVSATVDGLSGKASVIGSLWTIGQRLRDEILYYHLYQVAR